MSESRLDSIGICPRCCECHLECKCPPDSELAPASGSPAECEHDWKEEYYGVRCEKCHTFYPHGSEPWMPTDDALGHLQRINTFDDEPENTD